MIGLERLPSIPLLVSATFGFSVHDGCFSVQDICAVAGGEPGTPTTTHGVATFNSETAEGDDRRPNLLALVEPGLGRLEILSDHRQARDGGRLASEGLSSVLAMEEPERQARKTWCVARGSRSDSDDESQQPRLGRGCLRLNTVSCWRRATDSNASL